MTQASTATEIRYPESGAGTARLNGLRLKARSVAKAAADLVFLSRLRADKRRLDELRTMAELIPALCCFRGRGSIFANQEPGELTALAERLLARPPRVVLEIGTAKGGTLYLWSRIAAPGSLLISIDKPGETGSVGKPALAVYRGFGRDRKCKVFPIAGDSHAERTQLELANALAGRKVDFLFIDGDHSYEGVKQDFDGYRKFMAPQGLIALHDIAVDPADRDIQVARFWSELKGQAARTEPIISRPGRTPGIGLVFLD